MCRKSASLGLLQRKPTLTRDEENTFYQGIFPTLESFIQFALQVNSTISKNKNQHKKSVPREVRRKSVHPQSLLHEYLHTGFEDNTFYQGIFPA